MEVSLEIGKIATMDDVAGPAFSRLSQSQLVEI
jgi:hypothetical protein